MNEDQENTPAVEPTPTVSEPVTPEVVPEVLEEKVKAKSTKTKAETVSKEKYDALAAAALKALTQYRVNHKDLRYPGMAEIAALLDS